METPAQVTPGSVRAGEFAVPIVYQRAFLSPVRIVQSWDDSEAIALLRALKSWIKNAAKAKSAKRFKRYQAKIEQTHEALAAQLDAWPHRFVLEDPAKTFEPFAPKKPSKTVADLSPLPVTVTPAHETIGSLKADPVWSRKAFNARTVNREAFFDDLTALEVRLRSASSLAAEITSAMVSLTPPSEAAADWASLPATIDTTLKQAEKLCALARFWLLNLRVQMEGWLEHLAVMGRVDRATAVYIKALRECGRIQPAGRSAYQMFLNPSDFANAEEGATFIRTECTARPTNVEGKRAKTMPEMIALQFFANESGMKFTRRVAPFNTRPEDRNTRMPLMGIDTNGYRRGSFDAVFHAGGPWCTSRGWGIGQETEADTTLAGVRLKRGLPIVPSDATEVRHPPSFTNKEKSFRSALERKVLAKYDARTKRTDCTFADAAAGLRYSCHECLGRFFKLDLVGSRRSGLGGVFVPYDGETFGSLKGAVMFWLDLERITEVARHGGKQEDLEILRAFPGLFGRPAPSTPSDAVLAVLRGEPGGTAVNVRRACSEVAEARGLDEKTVSADVRAHIEARRDLPCSWLTTRIRYAGSRPQAFESLMDLLHIVGKLDTKNETLRKNIEEASAHRESGSRK